MKDAGIIGFVPRGEYSDTETYDFLQFVYYEDSSYVAKKETKGNKPAENNEYWQLLAKGRVFGVSGVKGEKETTYRTGDVNLTAANVGALPVTGGTISSTTEVMVNLKNIGSGTNAALGFEKGDKHIGHVFMSESTNGVYVWCNEIDGALLRLSPTFRQIYDYKTNSLKEILVQGDNIGDCTVNGKKLSEWLK